MKDDLPDFLSDDPSFEPEAAPSPEPAAQPEPQPTPEPEGPVRAPDGRFASPQTAEPEPAPQPAPAAPVEPAHHVPLTTFLDVRDKLSAAEKRARELEEWRAQQEAAANRQPMPSREEDPEAYEAAREALFDQRLFVQNRETSRRLAVMEHGKQTVDAAFEWGAQRCDEDPHFNAKVRGHNDPLGFVVAEWRRDQVASKVDPNEYDDFLKWKKSGGSTAAPATAPGANGAPAPAPAAPRASLAGGPSAGARSEAALADGEENFKQMFGP